MKDKVLKYFKNQLITIATKPSNHEEILKISGFLVDADDVNYYLSEDVDDKKPVASIKKDYIIMINLGLSGEDLEIPTGTSIQ